MLKILPFILVITGCSNLFFFPSAGLEFRPSDLGYDYSDVWLNEELHAWHLKPFESEVRGSILFLHGNAQNLANHFPAYSWLADEGFNVLALDYSGFGLSGGKADFQSVQRDVSLAWSWLEANLPGPHIVYGQSIGGSFALSLLGPAETFVIESAPADFVLIGKEKLRETWITYPISFLVSLVLPGDFSPLDKVKSSEGGHFLFIHAKDDNIVPFHHSELLFESAGERAQFWSYPIGGHISAFLQPGFKSRLSQFVAKESD